MGAVPEPSGMVDCMPCSAHLLLRFRIVASIVSGRTKTEFFPVGDPPIVYVYLKMPVGTKTSYTDSVTHLLEEKVFQVLGDNNPIVESVISNVAVGATDPFREKEEPSLTLAGSRFHLWNMKKEMGQKTSKYVDRTS